MNEFISNPFGFDLDFYNKEDQQKLNNTNTNKLQKKYGLTYREIDEYTTTILSEYGTNCTIKNLESYIKSKGHTIVEEEVPEEFEDKLLFRTTQNNVVVPTKELIKNKNTDFRVLLSISIISNVDNTTLSGSNSRYCSIRKVDRNMDKLCKAIGISPSQFRKHLKALLKHNTDEFKIIEKEYNKQKVMCYEINYVSGGFVTIPVKKVESLLVGGSNNCIKLYSNLLWLCTQDGEFVERELTQDYLAELMGLSPSTQKVVRIATKWLVGAELIRIRKVWESETIIGEDGMPKGSKPKSKIYYSIVV